jgi:hypothetical protein
LLLVAVVVAVALDLSLMVALEAAAVLSSIIRITTYLQDRS